MTVHFRMPGSLFEGPVPRSQSEEDLIRDLSTHIRAPISASRSVDSEDWLEPAAMLLAFIRTGETVLIFDTHHTPRRHTVLDMAAPLRRIEGAVNDSIIVHSTLERDLQAAVRNNAKWPAANFAAPNGYAVTKTFERHAGRRIAVADMPGEGSGPPGVSTISAETALMGFAGGTCFLKQVVPARSHRPTPIAVCEGDDPMDLLLQALEWNMAHHEGSRDALLFQEELDLCFETRFFVVDHKPVTGAACIEAHTPATNATGQQFFDLFELRRNQGPVTRDRVTRDALLHKAGQVARDLKAERPDWTGYCLDLAIDRSTGGPVVIEINPLVRSGLYGISARHLAEAIVGRG